MSLADFENLHDRLIQAEAADEVEQLRRQVSRLAVALAAVGTPPYLVEALAHADGPGAGQ